MKHKKTVTESVLAANRANAKSSTGPRTDHGKSNSSRNNFRHGILARRVMLKSDKEQAEFQRLFQRCQEDLNPEGVLETALTEEITIIFWKLRITNGLESKELSRRQEDSQDQIDGIFHKDLKLPVSDWDLPLDKGWACDRIVVRAVADNDVINSNGSRAPTIFNNQLFKDFKKLHSHNSQEGHHLEVEAFLGSSLDKLSRYQSGIESRS